jgi:glycosyltransferase involved in cell wall biosynthesis
MVASDPVTEQPLVSVIVPARNEEATLGTCLQSLVPQDGLGFEVIVVDDSSSDRTRKVAESFSNVRVVDGGPLPPNWTGKNNAVAAGARKAKGKWLLFTDADTVHKRGSLARAVAEAEEHGAALLSYSPEQEVHGFWEKSVMPVIFAELARTYRPRDVCNPVCPVAAANGQYLLISREAYDAVGGHSSISNKVLEDVALARAVKASGRRLRFRYGGEAVRTRMYRGFAQLREGWTKNLAVLFPSTVRLAALRFAEFILIVAGAAIAFFARSRPGLAMAATTLALILYLIFLKRIRRAQFAWQANVLALLGLPLFSYLLLRSRIAYKQGRVVWKGRAYGGRERTDFSDQPRRVGITNVRDLSA